MSYRGFGKWRIHALRLIYDDLHMGNAFYQSNTNGRDALCTICPYEIAMLRGAMKAAQHHMDKHIAIVPTLALLVEEQSDNQMPSTHAVAFIVDAQGIRLFDPNGRYGLSTGYLIKNKFVQSKQILPFLAIETATPLSLWSKSIHGIQNTINEPITTHFVPNHGYCMFLCKALILYIQKHIKQRKIKNDTNIMMLVREFERKECPNRAMGQFAKKILMDSFPIKLSDRT